MTFYPPHKNTSAIVKNHWQFHAQSSAMCIRPGMNMTSLEQRVSNSCETTTHSRLLKVYWELYFCTGWRPLLYGNSRYPLGSATDSQHYTTTTPLHTIVRWSPDLNHKNDITLHSKQPIYEDKRSHGSPTSGGHVCRCQSWKAQNKTLSATQDAGAPPIAKISAKWGLCLWPDLDSVISSKINGRLLQHCNKTSGGKKKYQSLPPPACNCALKGWGGRGSVLNQWPLLLSLV